MTTSLLSKLAVAPVAATRPAPKPSPSKEGDWSSRLTGSPFSTDPGDARRELEQRHNGSGE